MFILQMVDLGLSESHSRVETFHCIQFRLQQSLVKTDKRLILRCNKALITDFVLIVIALRKLHFIQLALFTHCLATFGAVLLFRSRELKVSQFAEFFETKTAFIVINLNYCFDIKCTR